MRRALFALGFLFLLALAWPPRALALCGSYFSGQCVDAASGQEVGNPVQCSQNPQICCGSQLECDQQFNQSDDPFGGTSDEPTPTDEDQFEGGSEFQQNQTRGCGTYFPTVNECNNAELSGPEADISPFVVCGNGVSCCPEVSMCPVAPIQPEPEEDEVSSESCGALQRDFTCRDSSGRIIPNFEQCSGAGEEYIANECCRELGQCSLRPVVPDPVTETTTTSEAQIAAYNFCLQAPEGSQRDACVDCLGQADVQDRIYTAVGCLRTSKTGLAGDLIRLGLGIGGGLALVSILAASFLYATSQGDQAKTKTARELATGAVSGLLFMIFSVIILNFVGVEILKIPGLAGGGAPVEQTAPQTQEEALTTTELLRIRPQLTPMFDGFRIEPNEPLEFCARSAERSAFDSQYGLSFSGTCLFGGSVGCDAPFPPTTALSPVRDSTGGQYEQCVTVSNVDLWSEGVIRDYLTEQLGAETVARLNITVVDTHNETPGYQTYIVRIEPVDAASQQAWFSAYQQIVTLDPIVYSLNMNWLLSEENTFAGSWQIRIDFDRSNFPQG